MNMKNTLKKGQVRIMVFKEGGTWYGAALEFNIVESGNDPREVMLFLDEAIRGYLETAHKVNASDDVLNQKADPEYEKLWKLNQSNKPIKSPFQIYSSGFMSLPSLA
jgi:predicted RNase H-like HicB family nuclease